MAKKSSFISKLMSLIILPLSALIIISFFVFPTFSIKEKSTDSAIEFTGYEVAIISTMTKDSATEYAKKLLDENVTLDETTQITKLLFGYGLVQTDEGANIQTTFIFWLALGLLSVLILLTSLFAMLRKGPGILTILLSLLGLVSSILVLVFAMNSANGFNSLLELFNVGIATYIALASSIVIFILSVIGKTFSKK